jgi:signal transduction histidine kinase
LRLAQELHDGLLQALTAARLKLHSAGAGATADQRQSLASVAEVLDEEQRQLRIFIEQNRADQFDGPRHTADDWVLEELRGHVGHLRKLWNCDVELKLPAEPLDLAPGQRSALKPLIDEGVANAVTHGHATQVKVTVFQDPQNLCLTIKDNGSGLREVNGDFDQDTLERQKFGPRSMQRRIVQLGGSLRLNSSSEGVELKIALPRLLVSGRCDEHQ